MKKSVIIICAGITICSLAAYGMTTWKSDPLHLAPGIQTKFKLQTYAIDNPITGESQADFVYEVGSQFRVTITKEALNNAISLRDLVPNEVTEGISSFRDVNIAIGSPYQNTAVKSSDERLNSDQIKLLKSLNYSTNFRIEAFSSSKNLFTGILEEKCFVYYVTVIPEKEASYKLGNEALLTYLRAKSSKVTANIEKDQMQSAKLRFKVTKNGTITNLKLKGTSGYSEVDRKMFELIMNMSGKWNPAETANGKKVAQELVFSFGSVGC